MLSPLLVLARPLAPRAACGFALASARDASARASVCSIAFAWLIFVLPPSSNDGALLAAWPVATRAPVARQKTNIETMTAGNLKGRRHKRRNATPATVARSELRETIIGTQTTETPHVLRTTPGTTPAYGRSAPPPMGSKQRPCAPDESPRLITPVRVFLITRRHLSERRRLPALFADGLCLVQNEQAETPPHR